MSGRLRILLDECVPGRLKRDLPGHHVVTVREHGWASKLDGELLRHAQGEFDVLLTVDRGIVHQQNLAGLQLAIIVLVAFTNNIRVLRLLVPELLDVLRTISTGDVIHIGPPST